MYRIVHYHPDMFGKVLELMKWLHGDRHDVNKAHFQWKYCDNPYADRPLGIVALHNNDVVGFRGYLATAWNKAMVLCAGDTIVHLEHRKKGLSIAMGEEAHNRYVSQYDVFMNFSGTTSSIPGYLKLGFVPLVDKVYLYKDSLDKEGQLDDVYESQEPMPYKAPDNVIALVRDDKFLKWRFRNNKNKYTFYRCQQDCITVSMNENYSALILDYTENDVDVLKRIIQYATNVGSFTSIMIKDFSLSNGFSQVLKELGFKSRSKRRVVPVLVRPTGDDWLIDGLDIRKVGSWELRGICSDNV